MKAFQTSILCSVLLLALAGCRSTSYHIHGTIEGAADGDTLYLTSDLMDGTPSATILVKDGKFSYDGEADSIYLAMVYSASRNEINATFIVEPGDITIHMEQTPGASRVGGTNCNTQWQRVNDSVMVIGKEVNRIAEHIYGNNISQEEQQRGMAQIEQLNRRFSDVVTSIAEQNIDNEFGYFLLVYFPEDIITDDKRQELIRQMPEELRNRPAIKKMEAAISKAAQTAEGKIIQDFTQQAPDGAMVSIMSEVKKNKVTIIDFWASWCGPCRQEMPFMIKLYNQFKDRGLGIVGVSLDEERDAWTAAIAKLNIPWPQMSDLKGWENAAAQAFSINSIPHTIVVDQQGRILRRGLRGEELEKFIAEQL